MQDDETALASEPGPVMFALLGLIIVSLSFGLGSTLEVSHVRATFQRKLPPTIGLACQYAVMPAVAYGLAQAFSFTPAKSIGLLLCGIVPGGSTSNLFTYYIGGDVGLSIFMTVSSVVAAVGMVPLLLWAYGTPLLTRAALSNGRDSFEVPYSNIVASLLLVFLPTLGGVFLRSRSARWAERAEKIGSGVGALFILGALVDGIVNNIALFDSDAATWVASAALSVIGFGCGALAAYVMRLAPLECLTIGLEVGVQNTILSISIAFVTFAGSSNKVRNEALIFPLMCSLWDVVNSILFLGAVQLSRWRGGLKRGEEENKGCPTEMGAKVWSRVAVAEAGGVNVGGAALAVPRAASAPEAQV